MGVGGVGLGEVEIAADHFQAGVAEELLEGVDVSAVSEVVDGEGVPEAVRVDVGYAGACAEGGEVVTEVGAVELGALLGDEEPGSRGPGGVSIGEVGPKGLGGAGADVDGARFGLPPAQASFSQDGGGAGLGVDVADVQVAELGGTYAGIQQKEDEGAIAELLAAWNFGLGVGAVVPLVAVVGGVYETVDLGEGERLDVGRLGGGHVDCTWEVLGGVAFFDGPGPERA